MTASTLVGVGVIAGTLQYMAPEQIDGQPVDERCDIFALGVILYEMLAGRPAFAGDTPVVDDGGHSRRGAGAASSAAARGAAGAGQSRGASVSRSGRRIAGRRPERWLSALRRLRRSPAGRFQRLDRRARSSERWRSWCWIAAALLAARVYFVHGKREEPGAMPPASAVAAPRPIDRGAGRRGDRSRCWASGISRDGRTPPGSRRHLRRC